MDKDKATLAGHHVDSKSQEARARSGRAGGFSGKKSQRTRRRMERLAAEEHAVDKPKKLETQTDGDLSEVKKDPVWKTWLKQKDATNTKQAREKLPRKEYCPTCGQVDPVASGQQKEEGQSHGEQSTTARGGVTGKETKDRFGHIWGEETSPKTSGWKTGETGGKGFRNALYHDLGDPRDYSHEYYPGQMSDRDDKGVNVHMDTTRDYDRESFNKRQRDDKGAMKKKAWEVWLEKDDEYDKEFTSSGEKKQTRAGQEKEILGHYTSQSGTRGGRWAAEQEKARHKKMVEAKAKEIEAKKLEAKEKPKMPKTAKEIKEYHNQDLPDSTGKFTRGGKFIPKHLRKKSWEVWLDNITKPIPDSKGGRGSFQHCINANQDKNNPGGWCKQIERKIGKGLGALGEGKLNRKTGKPMKLKPRKITLDEFESENQIDEKARKKREFKYHMSKEKTDYFVEEIRANIIYHNKIFPLIGMIAGSVARGVGAGAKKVGGELLDGMGDMAKEQSKESEDEK